MTAGRTGLALVWQTFPLGLLGADQSGRDRTCRRSLREAGDLVTIHLMRGVHEQAPRPGRTAAPAYRGRR